MPWTGDPRTSTTAHRAWRQAILSRDPICRCRTCKHHAGPCTHPATEADHITPVTTGGQTTLANGQGLCGPCHAQKTSAEANRQRWSGRTRPQPRHPGLTA